MSAIVGFAEAAWSDFKTSKTVKAVLTAEALAVAGFVESVLDGSIQLNRTTVAAFVASQVAGILVLTVRHALAELKAHADGLIPPEKIDAIAAAERDKAIAFLKNKGHEVAAEALKNASSSAAPLPVV